MGRRKDPSTLPVPRRRGGALAGAHLQSIVLLTLLLSPGLLASVSAQTPDTPPTPDPRPLVELNRYDVLEGSNVSIRLTNFARTDVVEVKCVSCSDPAYTAPAQRILVFPDDFGEQARNLRQPRWIDAWTVTLLGPGGVPKTPRSADPSVGVVFNSTIVDLFRFPDRQVEPGDRIVIKSSGYTGPQRDLPVTIKITKTNASSSSREDVVYTFPNDEFRDTMPHDGTVSYAFRFNPRLARALDCGQDPFMRCREFKVRVSGAGKAEEVVSFVVRPARLRTVVEAEPTTDNATMAQVNRTLTVHSAFKLVYRSGFEFATFLDYGFGKGPKYEVERVTGDPAVGKRSVYNGTARWSDDAFGWVMNWTIPRDADTQESDGLPIRYRFVVVQQKDPYKNDIPRRELNLFEVVRYDIPFALRDAPVVVERTQKAVWIANLTYADGRPFTSADNQSQLRACFFPKSETRPQVPCLNRPTVEGKHSTGPTWRFETSWNIDEPRVGQDWVMAPAWTASNPVTDREGNRVLPGPVGMFNLSVAKPRIDITTAVGEEKRVGGRPLERGDVVNVVERILYPDGTTPFNRTRNVDGRELQLFISKKNSVGDVVGVQVLNLTNPDNRETWIGSFELGRTPEAAPAGLWEFKTVATDKQVPPNTAVSIVQRRVVPAAILAATTQEPPAVVDIGKVVKYAFKLAYRDGTPVTGGTPGVTIRAEVRPVSALPGILEPGPPVETLAPTWDDFRQEWVAQWAVGRQLPLAKYVIVPSGSDGHGNVVRSDVTSRTVQLVTQTFTRAVLTQPQAQVPRGDPVVVVFEGREGDIGLDGTGKPVIVVQRYDGKSQMWIPERLDVRAADEPGEEHTGIWNTTLATQAGTYRFFLLGKDESFAIINATSRPFVLQTVVVSRAAVVNGTNVTKGQSIFAAIEREEGDSATDAYVVYEGKRFTTIGARRAERDNISVQWTVPFTFPTGAFTVVIEARDRSNNSAFGEVGPFFVSSSEIRSETLIDPVRIVERGSLASWSFRSFYPSGSKLDGRSGMPDVTVYNASGPVARASVKSDGPNYLATWEVPRSADDVDHWFVLGGRDSFGNDFIGAESDRFRVEPGTFGRTIRILPPASNPRNVLTGFQILTDPDDKEIEGSVVKLRADSAQAALNNFIGQPVAKAAIELSPDGSYWTASWLPEKDAPLGWYRFRIVGSDRFGNSLDQWSGAFQITPSQLPIFIRPADAPRSITPGQPFTVPFTVTYPDRTPVEFRGSRVVAQILKDDVPVPPEAVVTANGTLWSATWDTPETLDQGRYRFVISGFDALGNIVLRGGTSPVEYAPTNWEKLLGVPGPGALGALLAVGLAVLVFGRRRR